MLRCAKCFYPWPNDAQRCPECGGQRASDLRPDSVRSWNACRRALLIPAVLALVVIIMEVIGSIMEMQDRAEFGPIWYPARLALHAIPIAAYTAWFALRKNLWRLQRAVVVAVALAFATISLGAMVYAAIGL